MADYYVIYQGTTYEVADFAAGITKAQELGPDAVFYVTVSTPSTNTYAQGVKTVFSGGAGKYIFGGSNSATQPATTNVTIDAGTYSLVLGGGYKSNTAFQNDSTEVNIAGGSTNYAYAGSWGARIQSSRTAPSTLPAANSPILS